MQPYFEQKIWSECIADMLMFDAAHVYVHDGLADSELGQRMKAFFSNKLATSFKERGEYHLLKKCSFFETLV